MARTLHTITLVHLNRPRNHHIVSKKVSSLLNVSLDEADKLVAKLPLTLPTEFTQEQMEDLKKAFKQLSVEIQVDESEMGPKDIVTKDPPKFSPKKTPHILGESGTETPKAEEVKEKVTGANPPSYSQGRISKKVIESSAISKKPKTNSPMATFVPLAIMSVAILALVFFATKKNTFNAGKDQNSKNKTIQEKRDKAKRKAKTKNKKQITKQIKALKKALKTDPDNAKIKKALSDAFFEKAMLEDQATAIEKFLQFAISFNTRNQDAMDSLESFYKRTDQPQLAMDINKKSQEAQKVLLTRLGTVVEEAGRLMERIKIKNNIITIKLKANVETKKDALTLIYQIVWDLNDKKKFRQINIEMKFGENKERVGVQSFMMENRMPKYPDWLEQILIYDPAMGK